MLVNPSKAARFALALGAFAFLCLGSTAFAGPDPAYVMINGKLMKVVPLAKDTTMKNGCKVCTVGVFTDAKGKTVFLKNGDVVYTNGTVAKASAGKVPAK
jgi:hypothetical protein